METDLLACSRPDTDGRVLRLTQLSIPSLDSSPIARADRHRCLRTSHRSCPAQGRQLRRDLRRELLSRGSGQQSGVDQRHDRLDGDQMPKPPWRERKEAHIAHMATASKGALVVIAADKLHNVTCMID